MNIVDYVKDYKTTFDNNGFNKVDGLVLSELSYMDYSSLGIDVGTNSYLTISSIYNQLVNTDYYDKNEFSFI